MNWREGLRKKSNNLRGLFGNLLHIILTEESVASVVQLTYERHRLRFANGHHSHRLGPPSRNLGSLMGSPEHRSESCGSHRRYPLRHRRSRHAMRCSLSLTFFSFIFYLRSVKGVPASNMNRTISRLVWLMGWRITRVLTQAPLGSWPQQFRKRYGSGWNELYKSHSIPIPIP